MGVVVTPAASDEFVMTDDRLMYELGRILLRESDAGFIDNGGERERALVESEIMVARELRRKTRSSS